MQIYCNVKRHLCIETPKGFVMVLCFTDLRQEDKSEWLVRVLRNPFPYLLTPQEIWFHLICFHETCKSKVSNDIIHVGKASCFCRHFAGALWETLSVRSRKARGVFRGPWQPCGQPWCRSSFIQDRWWEEILYEGHFGIWWIWFSVLENSGWSMALVPVRSWWNRQPTMHSSVLRRIARWLDAARKVHFFKQELQEFSWRHLRWWSILWILWSLFLLVSVLNFPPRWWILWGPWQLEVHAFHLHCFGQRIFLVPFWHRVHHCNDVILVIPKLLQVYSCATCHSYWVLVWCKDVWVMCTVVSCKPCEAVPCGSVSESYSWCFPVAVSLLRDLALSVSPKRWGISSNMVQKPVAPWSIHTCRILVGIQNIIERRFEGPWVDSVNSMIKNKKLT